MDIREIDTPRGEHMLKTMRIVMVLVLVLAACGGDEGAGDNGGDGGDDATTTTSTTTTTTTTSTTTTVASSGGGGDFCDFVAAQAQTVTPSPVGLTPAEVEENFNEILDTITMAAEIAPNDIRGDVQLFVNAYGGLVEFLGEYEFNFLAIPEADLDDPRLNALEDQELEAAGDRIEDYCGIDSFIETPPAGGAPQPGGGTGALPGEVPEGFPTDLIPPGGEVVAVVSVAGANSVTFDVVGDTDELIAFFSDELGPPVQALESPKGALWVTEFDGEALTLTVAETGPNMVQVNVTLGG